MQTNLINQLADILEYKITSRNHNNTHAARLFRDAQCVYNDYRTVKILNMTFDFLIQQFKKEIHKWEMDTRSKWASLVQIYKRSKRTRSTYW